MKRRVYICPDRLGTLARQGLTDGEIAAKLGCTPSGVSNARKLHGIASQPRGRRAGRDYEKRIINSERAR